ncbi:putative electron transfer flavoprotein subunit alpha, mitochondrial [Iris pallida]|uniref:Electron transfer flavoprotein subunit alpha n=1 Tax=Iris pallida TaxID=29817 RepID=A0AAX6I6S8_IRIPA|nr:putative electron transfer flavoprotein subunit alpha, mitochondrial [Iris pallida]
MMSAMATARALRNRTLLFSSIPSSPIRTTPISRFMSTTLVLAEHENGHLKPSSLSAVAAAGAIGRESPISLLLGGSGPGLRRAAEHAASVHPSISEVLVADADALAHPLAENWAELVRFVQRKGGYSYVVAASSSFGKNVLPRAAALLDVSPVTDVVEIREPRVFVRPIYAGNALCTVRYVGMDPCIMTIRSTSFAVPPTSTEGKSNAAPISQVDLSNFSEAILGKSRWLKLTSQNTERPDLGNARVVVTGGRGLKSAENFKLLEKLAEKLGAAVGATRAAVDAGFVPNDLQVGQTGKIVAPELYMAFGVSGAIQHLAGMRDSKVIVAINKDGDAPIFQVADYGLVGDLFDVIPELLEKLPEQKK